MEEFVSYFKIGDIVAGMVSNVKIRINESLKPFEITASSPDITIIVNATSDFPSVPHKYLGHDLLLEYYKGEDNYYYTFSRGKSEHAVMCKYKADFSETYVYLNESKYPGMIWDADKILPFLPICQFLYKNNAMLLRSSCIVVDHKSIVFTVPGQADNTTQAKLWHECEGAEIINKNRTLLRKIHSQFYTYGCSIDENNPAYANTQYELGAIVILQQSNENRIIKMNLFQKIKYLMEQTIVDTWNKAEQKGMEALYRDLIEACPVYLLEYTSDQNAVNCLKQQLKMDEIS
ncbi:MAG: hypothetical protein LUH07_05250 [Lachnospiraceae bacterium]|nr:hypothetical protein [Lachnospiraceae bacterium]